MVWALGHDLHAMLLGGRLRAQGLEGEATLPIPGAALLLFLSRFHLPAETAWRSESLQASGPLKQ